MNTFLNKSFGLFFKIVWGATKITLVLTWMLWSLIGAVPVAGTALQATIAGTVFYYTGAFDVVANMFEFELKDPTGISDRIGGIFK